ncbi:hypothetical protein [Bacillus salacetis]|nr:hypothetical protein [Bacillus salacetis]
MKTRITKLTYDEIDKLLEPADNDMLNDINWKFVSEEEIENLLQTP